MYPAGERGVRAHFVKTASGLRVRTVESGSADAPAIVFVPGWACSAWTFHDALPAVGAAGFRAIAIDLKGHGLSGKPTDPAEYTVESMRDHLIDVLDALALPAAGMVGHSMGAALAAHVAHAVPDRVTRLALVAPVGFSGVIGMSLLRAFTPRFALPIFPRLAGRPLVWAMLRIAYGSLTSPTRRDVDEYRAPTQFPEFTTALRHLLHVYDWNADFPRLSMPHMVIVGSRDHLCRPKTAGRYAGGRPPIVIKGAAHAIFPEAPDLVNRTLVDFFREDGNARLYFDSNEQDAASQGIAAKTRVQESG
jgi:pimeloyl-ACP methyl ester carboxylesterase